MVLTYYILD